MVSVPALRQVQCEWIQSQRRSNRHIHILDFLSCVFVDPSNAAKKQRKRESEEEVEEEESSSTEESFKLSEENSGCTRESKE